MNLSGRGAGIQDPVSTNWLKSVDMVQMMFRDIRFLEEATWQDVFPLPNMGGYFRLIGLLEVPWKMAAVILYRCPVIAIEFHDVLHGFWAG